MWWNPLCGSLTDTDQEVLTCFSTEMARYTVRKHIHYMWLCFLFFFSFTGGWGWPTLTHSHTCSSSQPFSTPTMQKRGLALLFAFCQIVINSNLVTLGQREHSLVIPCIHTLFTCLSHLCSLCFSLPSHVDPVQHRPPCASALVHPLSFFVDKISFSIKTLFVDKDSWHMHLYIQSIYWSKNAMLLMVILYRLNL